MNELRDPVVGTGVVERAGPVPRPGELGQAVDEVGLVVADGAGGELGDAFADEVAVIGDRAGRQAEERQTVVEGLGDVGERIDKGAVEVKNVKFYLAWGWGQRAGTCG